jgi:ribosomal protein RSM22 (predicted rRNA methylase)
MLREKAKILAPCPHNQQCPIVKEGYQWCHFEQNVTHWPKNVFPKEISDSNIINEKYSYIIFQKTV